MSMVGCRYACLPWSGSVSNHSCVLSNMVLDIGLQVRKVWYGPLHFDGALLGRTGEGAEQRSCQSFCGICRVSLWRGGGYHGWGLCSQRSTTVPKEPLRTCWIGGRIPKDGCSRSRKRIHMAVGTCQQFPSIVLRVRSELLSPVHPLGVATCQSLLC